LGKALADVAKRFCMIPIRPRAWLVGLGLALGVTLTAGGSTSAVAQSRSPNANVVDELLAELGANPGTIARSGVPKCSSPASSSSPFVILDNQTYALCAVASCFVFNEVAYCKCDVKFGDSLSVTDEFDTQQDVCTVNAEGVNNGYMVSTFSPTDATAKGTGDMAVYTCPRTSNGDYAQCDGGICFTSTQGKSFPGFDGQLAADEIICSCPIVEHSPSAVGYQIAGPWPCQPSFFENCTQAVANSNTGSTLYVGAPTGVARAAAFILTGKILPTNECRLP
jgi:hypothetical protein